MYAVVSTGGKQLKVEEGTEAVVEKLNASVGDNVALKVLFVADGEEIIADSDALESASVNAEVVEHFKGEKQLVFKFKRRKGYKRLRGHRQEQTRIKVTGIDAADAKKAAKNPTKKAKTAPEAESKAKKAEGKVAAGAKKVESQVKAEAKKVESEVKAEAKKVESAVKAEAKKVEAAAKKAESKLEAEVEKVEAKLKKAPKDAKSDKKTEKKAKAKTEAAQCEAIKGDGERCGNKAKDGSKYCGVHAKKYDK